MNAETIIAGIRHRYTLATGQALPDDALIGVKGITKDVLLDESKGNRDIEQVFNTDDVDLDEEVVLPSGLDTAYYEANGRKVFVDHQYGIMDVVGKDRWIRAEPKGGPRRWVGKAAMMTTPLGEQALTIVRELGSIGTSIGFVVTAPPLTGSDAKAYAKGGKTPVRVLTETRLLERSLTCMPCNVSCQGALSADQSKLAGLDELVVKHKVSRAAAVAFGLPTTPARKFHAVTTPRRRAVVVVDSAMLIG